MKMDLSPNFTPKSQQLIVESKLLAVSLNHTEVTADHLLISLLRSDGGFIRQFINGFGLSVDSFIYFITTFSSLEKKEGQPSECSYADTFRNALGDSHTFSTKLGHTYIGVEHLFFSLINSTKGAAANFFLSEDVSPSSIMEAFLGALKTQQILLDTKRSALPSSLDRLKATLSGAPPSQGSALESFGINLNELSIKGSLGKIIGKDSETSRMCEVLGRKIKNNPLLLGEPGVGKTAIVEGLAQRIVKGKVPAFLADKEIWAVDLASMIAGTKYRGQFEQRLKTLLLECQENPKIVLFIDETHTLIGAGSAEGTMDAANILKPALARGEVKFIGATTYSEYKKSIEKDMALSRRFEPIPVSEPTAEESYQILQGIKPSYESFHSVKYSASVLKHITSLCETYLPSKNFPDKAIDVLDEAGVRVKIKNLTPPEEIFGIEEEIYTFLNNEADALTSVDPVAVARQNDLVDSYDNLMREWEESIVTNVTFDDIIEVISSKAKVPKENLIHEKDKKSLALIQKLNTDIINQRAAVSAIHRCILRSKIGLNEPHKPTGSFLFLGSTGVGKTWAAKKLAQHYFGSEKNILRLDMSEYSEKVSSSKLIGASPGYVGYEEGGILTEGLKKKPHCVILFDEIEKCHPDVQQLLLQILEEGELEDNNGTKAYFKDSIIILTGNIGSGLTTKSSLGFSHDPNSNSDKIKEEAKKILSPELINRLDDVIVFNHLEKEHLIKIFKYNIRKLAAKLRRKKIYLKIEENAMDFICNKAADEKMGARPLKRLIQSQIEDQIVNHYFKTPTTESSRFHFYVSGDEVKFKLN
jgi:ATP-dependent Clp protease ATP-binding subunit ClpC